MRRLFVLAIAFAPVPATDSGIGGYRPASALSVTETIDRTVYESGNRRIRDTCDKSELNRTDLATSDRLRVDVGMGTGSEMHS